MNSRKIWFLKLTNDAGIFGIGEVAPIEGLSPENLEKMIDFLEKLQTILKEIKLPNSEEKIFAMVEKIVPKGYPSVRFGLEMALLDMMNGGTKHIFLSDWSPIQIPINGLVWMGDKDLMEQQIKEKLDEGYSCIKLKIGALDFDTEFEMIKSLRKISDNLVIRLDANGSFDVSDVLFKLKKINKLAIHSIEQPIMPNQLEAMELICRKSDIPIALDEELIGIHSSKNREDLLATIKPHYLVLKPTLHGGFYSVLEWINLAKKYNINWWVTSYLESNIGLNAIAQFVNRYPSNKEYHGLGTGGLYLNNIHAPIEINQGYFRYSNVNKWGEIN